MNKILKSIAITTISIIYGLGNYSLAAISKVKVDFNQNLLFIYGEDLTQTITDSLTVTLGNTNLTVCPNCYSATEITADLPTGLIDGDYMLKVASYGRASVNAGSGWLHNEYNLTVGAVGPQGIQGVQGLPGADGQDGADGTQGIQGEKGDKGDQGDQGLRGLTGADGADGEAGNLALAGQVCSSTTVPKGYDINGDIVCEELTSPITNFGQAYMPYWRVFKGAKAEQKAVIGITNISNQPLNITIKIYDENTNLIQGISPNRLFGVTNLNIYPPGSSMTFTLNSKFQTQINLDNTTIPNDTNGHASIEWSQENSQNPSISKGLIAQGFIMIVNGVPIPNTSFSVPINNGLPF